MSAPYGELVMVVGDAHVGHRALDIPEKFRKMLTPDKMQYLVSTGNLCSADTYDFFRSVAPKMFAVRGDMDDFAACNTTAEEIVFEVGEFRIGLCHGHQVVPWGDREALGLLARRLDVDILITGHTHLCEAYEMEGTWFVNPGSITGAYSPLRDEVRASFILLSIQANIVKLYMYELNSVSGEVDIRRARFTKPSKNPFQSTGGGLDSSILLSVPSPVKQPQTVNPPVPKRPQQQVSQPQPDTTVKKSPAPPPASVVVEQTPSQNAVMEEEPSNEAPVPMDHSFESAAQAAFGSSSQFVQSVVEEETITAALVEPNSSNNAAAALDAAAGLGGEERWDDV